MQSKVTTISEYMKSLPAAERSVIARLDALVREILPEAQASMKYGMPTYQYGEHVAALNSQKQYFSFYLAPALLDPHRAKLKAWNVGKSCVRFASIEKAPMDIFKTVLKSYRE